MQSYFSIRRWSILKIWYRLWSIRWFRFFIPRWSWYFKCIVFVWLFYLFSWIVDVKVWFSNISILCERQSNSLWRWDVLLFSQFTNIVSILYYSLHCYMLLSNFFCSIQGLYDCMLLSCHIRVSEWVHTL